MDNLSLQADELEALRSIYADDWHIVDESDCSYSMKITEGSFEVIIYLTLSLDYPTLAPPSVQLLAPSLSRMHKQQIALALDDIYLENIGQPVIYQLIEKIREYLQILHKEENICQSPTIVTEVKIKPIAERTKSVVQHGTIIQDRKSIFQGHIAEVHSMKDITDVMENLMENKKIAEATHNITAYRVQLDTGNILQDYNDDGENHAGRRLLHLLQIIDVTNVLVIVSRWYGGTQLGPDRFRHINNAGRQVLEQAGYIEVKKMIHHK